MQSKTLTYSLLAVSLLTIVAYFPALRGPFVFDDVNVIANDPAILSFPPQLQWLNPASRPLVGLTFSLNYFIGGLNPWGFHFVNLILHIGCGWLIAELVRSILIKLANDRPGQAELWSTLALRTNDIAAVSRSEKRHESVTPSFANLSAFGINSWVFLVTAFWMLHPLSSSAVAYVVQRSEILAACAIVGFQIAIIRDSTVSHRRWQWLGATIFVAGMCCKVNAISALPIALLLDRFLLSGSWRGVYRQRGLLYLVPILLGAIAFAVMLPALRRGEAGVGFADEIPTIPVYLATQSRVLWHYLALCVWPNDLCIDYRWPPVASIAEASPWIVLSLSLLAAGVLLYVRNHLLGWLILVVFLLLAPTSTFIPVTDIALDHRMYLATAAVIAGLLILCQDVAKRCLGRWSFGSSMAWAVAAAVLLAMFLRTSRRADDWSSSFDLWRSAAMVVPHNPRALQNLTNAADEEGRRGELLGVLEGLRSQSIANRDHSPAVASRLAEELMKSGHGAAVAPLLTEAIQGLRPTGPIDERQEHAAARINFGLLLLQQGKVALAEEQIKLGLASDAKQEFANAILGDLAFQRQDYGIAVEHFQRAIAIRPDWEQAKSDLAKATAALRQSGRDLNAASHHDGPVNSTGRER